MSLILDALRRAERERQLGRPPDLERMAQGDEPARSRLPWRWALAGVVILAALGIGLFVVRPARSPGAPPPAQAEAPSAAPLAPAAPPAAPVTRPAEVPAPAVPAQPAPPPPAVASADVVTLDDVTGRTAEREGQEPAAPATEGAHEPLETVDEDGVAQEGVAEDETSGDDTESMPDDSAIAAEPRNDGARRLRDMPAGYRADFPALNVDVHVYLQEKSRRFVLINGRRYREGERLSEGPQIIQIVADGILFDYRGERVLYPVTR